MEGAGFVPRRSRLELGSGRVFRTAPRVVWQGFLKALVRGGDDQIPIYTKSRILIESGESGAAGVSVDQIRKLRSAGWIGGGPSVGACSVIGRKRARGDDCRTKGMEGVC